MKWYSREAGAPMCQFVSLCARFIVCVLVYFYVCVCACVPMNMKWYSRGAGAPMCQLRSLQDRSGCRIARTPGRKPNTCRQDKFWFWDLKEQKFFCWCFVPILCPSKICLVSKIKKTGAFLTSAALSQDIPGSRKAWEGYMHIVCIGQSKLLQSEYKRKALGPQTFTQPTF